MPRIFWITSGDRDSALSTMVCPRSIRLAISTSPSRVSSGTAPISRRYMRTGSLVLSLPAVGEIQIQNLVGFFDFGVELRLFEDLDAGHIETCQQIVQVRATAQIGGQQLADFVVQNVALFLAHGHQVR